MLKQMTISNFTLLPDGDYKFSKGLNVVVGENSTGKSHLLKLAYSLIATSADAGRKPSAISPTKTYLQKAYADKLMGVFRPDALGRLPSRVQGRSRCEVVLRFKDVNLNTAISFASSSKSEVQVDTLPAVWDEQSPLYLPTRELMSIYPNFVAIYDAHLLQFEETWRDTCSLLGRPQLRGPRSVQAWDLLEPIEQALGSRIKLGDNGRFYLNNVEMPLLSEGHRKLAMLAQLVANGTIQKQSYIFWDEPEANLNPRLIRITAEVIHKLCKEGVQVFIATHSFFLLKELDLLSRADADPMKQKFFGLSRGEDGVISCEEADSLVGVSNLVTLDEELSQYDRELELANRA